MIKKLFLFLTIFFTVYVVCFGAWRKPDETMLYAPNVDSSGNLKVRTIFDNQRSILQSNTTAAFTIYLTSVNTTGTTTGKFTMYASSFTIEQLNTGGGATTNYFNVLLSTSDTIFDNINRTNEITNWTMAISPGCYGLQFATGAASVRVDNEGTTDGLQYDATGKAVSFSTGSANAVTIYFNAATTLSRYFPENSNTYYVAQILSTSTAKTNTMYLYEGVTSTITTSIIARPETDSEQLYSELCPVIATKNKAVEFRIIYSTWNATDDYFQIHISSN